MAGLPGLLPPDTPGWAPPTDKVLQRPMKARIDKAHAGRPQWHSIRHTMRAQIGRSHEQAYGALVEGIVERKRTPQWQQRDALEKLFRKRHGTVPIDASWR